MTKSSKIKHSAFIDLLCILSDGIIDMTFWFWTRKHKQASRQITEWKHDLDPNHAYMHMVCVTAFDQTRVTVPFYGRACHPSMG